MFILEIVEQKKSAANSWMSRKRYFRSGALFIKEDCF